MDASLVATLAAAGAAVAAAVVSLVALPFTIRAANAAKAQTELQAGIAAQARHPLLWADLRPDPDMADMLCLMVGNSGPTAARDVTVIVDPPVRPSPKNPMTCEKGQADASAGIASVGPGRTLVWALGFGRDLLEVPDQPDEFTLTISGVAPDGTPIHDQFTSRFSDIRWTSAKRSVGERFAQDFKHFRTEHKQAHRELLQVLRDQQDD